MRNPNDDISPETLAQGDYQKDAIKDPDGKAQTVWVNKSQNALDRLYRKDKITTRMWLAGDKLRTDAFFAGFCPRLGSSYDPTPKSPGFINQNLLHPTERQIMARKRFRLALSKVGIRLSFILTQIILQEISPTTYGHQNRKLGARRDAEVAGIEALRLALESLADVYNIPE